MKDGQMTLRNGCILDISLDVMRQINVMIELLFTSNN